MSMVSWVRDFFHLGAASHEAANELQKELDRSQVVKTDMERLRDDLQLRREAVHAKARAVLNHENEEDSVRPSPLAQTRPALKSTA
jgi:hypothetical protein